MQNCSWFIACYIYLLFSVGNIFNTQPFSVKIEAYYFYIITRLPPSLFSFSLSPELKYTHNNMEYIDVLSICHVCQINLFINHVIIFYLCSGTFSWLHKFLYEDREKGKKRDDDEMGKKKTRREREKAQFSTLSVNQMNLRRFAITFIISCLKYCHCTNLFITHCAYCRLLVNLSSFNLFPPLNTLYVRLNKI